MANVSASQASAAAGEILFPEVTIADINQFIARELGPVIDGKDMALVSSTFLSILLQQQGPDDMTLEELQAGVKEASATIALYLTSLRSPLVAN